MRRGRSGQARVSCPEGDKMTIARLPQIPCGAETLSPYATWEYSWIRPPSRLRRRTRISVTSASGCGLPCGRVLLERPARPMRVVVIDILAQDQSQVPFAGDQHPVQALAAGTAAPRRSDQARTASCATSRITSGLSLVLPTSLVACSRALTRIFNRRDGQRRAPLSAIGFGRHPCSSLAPRARPEVLDLDAERDQLE